MSSMLATKSSWRPSSLSTRLVARLLLYYRPLPGFMTRYGTGNLRTGRFRTLFFLSSSSRLRFYGSLCSMPNPPAGPLLLWPALIMTFFSLFFFDFPSMLLNLTARIFALACPSQLFFHTGSAVTSSRAFCAVQKRPSPLHYLRFAPDSQCISCSFLPTCTS